MQRVHVSEESMWNKVNSVYTVLNLLSLVEESMGSIIKKISF